MLNFEKVKIIYSIEDFNSYRKDNDAIATYRSFNKLYYLVL